MANFETDPVLGLGAFCHILVFGLLCNMVHHYFVLHLINWNKAFLTHSSVTTFSWSGRMESTRQEFLAQMGCYAITCTHKLFNIAWRILDSRKPKILEVLLTNTWKICETKMQARTRDPKAVSQQGYQLHHRAAQNKAYSVKSFSMFYMFLFYKLGIQNPRVI